MKLAFIGFGVASYGLIKGLRAAGIEEIYFFDNNWSTPSFQEVLHKRASETGAVFVGEIRDLVNKTDTVISCVTGSAALQVADQAAPYLRCGSLYIDVNSTSPMVKEKMAPIIEKAGVDFVDAAMMGPVPYFLHRVPILASGSGAARFEKVMKPYGMQINCLDGKAGKASALKMFRSIFMKGLVALLVEMLMATHQHEASDVVLRSIAETMDKNAFLETVRIIFPKGVISAERMAHEMAEVVETLEHLDLPSDMARTVQNKLMWCSRLGLQEQFGGEIPKTIDQALNALAEGVSRTKQ